MSQLQLRAQVSHELTNAAAEEMLRVERRGGEMLLVMEKNPGGQAEHEFYRSHDVTSRPPTYTELGLDKMTASRWQRLARLPEDEFDRYVEQAKAVDGSAGRRSGRRFDIW